MGDAIEAVRVDEVRALRCTVCSQRFGAYDEDSKRACLMRELPLDPGMPSSAECSEEHVLREYSCPGCGTALIVDVQGPEEPISEELLAHPRFVLHFTLTSSSWLNLVERWFGELTTKKLHRGAHTSVRALNTDIKNWIETWNDDPPYVWTKTADQILESIKRYCTTITDSPH